MWTATTRGFFSAVQHRDDQGLLVIRTRVKADAAHLETWYAAWRASLEALDPSATDGLPTPQIVAYAVSDYPWRVIVPRSAWGAFLAETVEDLDYGNFKDAVKDTQGTDRAQVYSSVWAALLRLEDLDPDSERRGWYDETDEPWWMYDDDAEVTEDPDEFWETDPTPAEVTAYLEAQE
jgi:hypothetical protein